MKASPAIRGLRAAVFGALCVLLAVGAHALATGGAPPVWAQGLGFVPVFVAAFALGGRERRLPSIGGGTIAAQGGLHALFGCVRPHAMVGAHMGHAHTMTAMGGMRMTHPHALTTHALTTHVLTAHATSAHVTAALVLTWWLRRGEAALWSLLRRAAAFVPGLVAWWRRVRGVPVVPRAVCRADAGEARPLRRLLLRHAVQRRGPPAGISYAI
ncbi:hypothetical protein [Streptomyces sp. NPDC046909]|uniref:hypothetical protein n=1 Tax=Streptomyces sp. NPDC046909 TaxID=3155617 RepID=UPI0033F32312